jgi:hypothetical protein
MELGLEEVAVVEGCFEHLWSVVAFVDVCHLVIKQLDFIRADVAIIVNRADTVVTVLEQCYYFALEFNTVDDTLEFGQFAEIVDLFLAQKIFFRIGQSVVVSDAIEDELTWLDWADYALRLSV